VNTDQSTIAGLGLEVLGVLSEIVAVHGLDGISHTAIGSLGVVLLLTGALVLHRAGHLRILAERRARRRAKRESVHKQGFED
jgi:hypothetical protein